jgi:hypothetical protein
MIKGNSIIQTKFNEFLNLFFDIQKTRMVKIVIINFENTV